MNAISMLLLLSRFVRLPHCEEVSLGNLSSNRNECKYLYRIQIQSIPSIQYMLGVRHVLHCIATGAGLVWSGVGPGLECHEEDVSRRSTNIYDAAVLSAVFQ